MSILVKIIGLTLFIYQMIVLARVILSWIQASPYDNDLVRFVFTMTEPPLAKIRSLIPPLGGMLDFSPLILLLGIHLLRQLFAPGSMMF